MDFKSITIEDKLNIEEYLKKANLGISEHCFTDIFMWQDHYKTMFFIDDEFLYIRSVNLETGEFLYMCPVGTGDTLQGINRLVECFGNDITIVSITENMREKLDKSDLFDFFESRDSADYIYLSEKLISLSGKKLHSKRNFVNRFISEYDGRWKFENITSDNKEKAWEFHLKWHKETDDEDENKSLEAETIAIKKVIDNFEELGAIGGILYIDGDVVAFTLATISTDDLAVIQIEKGDVNFVGVYPMINKIFAEKILFDVTFINREEDLGLQGLRKAKLSYKPEEVRMKYYAKLRR